MKRRPDSRRRAIPARAITGHEQDVEVGDIVIFGGDVCRAVESKGRDKRAMGELTPRRIRKATSADWADVGRERVPAKEGAPMSKGDDKPRCGNCRRWSRHKDCPIGLCNHPALHAFLPMPEDGGCEDHKPGKPRQTGEPKLDSPIGITCDE